MKYKRMLKRNYTPFVTGMATMALLIGLIASSFAANGGGAPEAAQVSVGLFGREMIRAGETLTTESGGKAPKVLACGDSKGQTHYYIEATVAAELFDVSYGALFNEELGRVEFGANPPYDGPWQDGQGNEIDPPEDYVPEWRYGDARHDFPILHAVTDANGSTVYSSEGFPVETGGFSVSVSARSNIEEVNDPEARAAIRAQEEKSWARTKERCSTEPKYGESLGMFTEVDPEEINLGSISGRSMDHQAFQDSEWIEHTFAFTPKLGRYAAITIENASKSDVQIALLRPSTVGDATEGSLSVWIPAGGSITRAFRLDEAKFLENRLTLRATPLGPDGVSVKLTAEQYRSGN